MKLILEVEPSLSMKKICRKMDSPGLWFENPSSLEKLLQYFNNYPNKRKFMFPKEMLFSRWKYIKSQVVFLRNLIEIGKVSIVQLNRRDLQQIKFNSQKKLPNKLKIWTFADLTKILFEISDSDEYLPVRAIFDQPLRNCRGLLLIVISKLKTISAMMEEIFS